MEQAATRLSVAQALGTIGLNDLAVELTLPADIDRNSELLLPSEITRLRAPRYERMAHARSRARERNLTLFTHNDFEYEGRVVELAMPPTATEFPFRRVLIRQGVKRDLIEELAAIDSAPEPNVDQRLKPYAAETGIEIESDSHHTIVSYGQIMFSDLAWF